MNHLKLASAFFAGAALLLAPIAIYIWHFGWRISSDHSQWAEMGSAMAGIYGPIIAAATLLMIYRQTRVMTRTAELQSRTTALLAAQELRQSNQDDLQSRWDRLKPHLEKISRRIEHRLLHTDKLESLNLLHYHLISNEGLVKISTQQRAHKDYRRDPSLLDSWFGIYSALIGLREIDVPDPTINDIRKSAFEQMRIHIAASLSTPVAMALDNMQFALERGGPFYFNENLTVLRELQTKPADDDGVPKV